MEISEGQIYYLDVTNPRTKEVENRPVIILQVEDVMLFALFATVTGSKIKNFDHRYDRWKVPLFTWKSTDLYKESYVKVNCMATTDLTSINSEDFLGKVSRRDLQNVKKKVKEFVDSGVEAW